MADLSSYINIQANTVKTIGDITPTNSASPAPSISGFDSISGVSLHATTDITAGGNIDIDGEASVGGNLTIIGNITFSGGGSITEVTSAYGNFFGNADGSNALYAGYPGGVVVPGGIAAFTGDSNAYMQINSQNRNHGTQASMEYVVTGDLGTDTTDYLDLGFASSTWDGTQDNSLGTAVAARDGYMYVQGGGGGGNLVLGTTTSGRKIKFAAGGPNAANIVANISSSGIDAVAVYTDNYYYANGVPLPTVSGSSSVSTTGNVTAGNVSTTGNVSAAALKGEGGNISNIQGANVSGAVAFATTANSVAAANVSGLGNVALINKDGSASNVLYGNGVFAPAASPYGNSNVATFLAAYGSNTITTTGNIVAGNIVGALANGTSNIAIATAAGNVVTTVGAATALTVSSSGIRVHGAGTILSPGGATSITLNNNGINVPTANITTFANITGTSGLSVTANANIGNIITPGLITATGNITGGNLVTSGALSVTGNANVGNIGTAGLITATGNITGGNLITGGNISATGNITANNLVGSNLVINGNAVGYGVTTPTIGSNTSPVTGAITATTSSAATTILTVAIPSAGTWQIVAQVNAALNNGQECVFGLWDGTGTFVANSETRAGYVGGGATYQGQGTSLWTVTTNGAVNYTVRAWAPGAVANCTIGNGADGRTNVSWTLMNTPVTLNGMLVPSNISVSGNVYANNIQGTTPNVSLVAGSYTYIFDNTGNFIMPTNSDIVFSANTTLTSGTGTNGNVTVNPDGTGQFVLTSITPATFGNSLSVTGNITSSSNISATGNVSGYQLYSTASAGDEGGQINLAIPVTNTSLANTVTVDVYQNKFRIFEGSTNAKGVFVDLNKAPNGVGGELLYKASGLVNAGTDVTLGNLKARIPTSGNRSLQLSTVSGTYNVYGSDVYSYNGGIAGTTIDGGAPKAITTTPTYLNAGYNFGTAGATDTWVIMDTSNTIAWRITMILGSGFNNNMISIERLV